MPTTKLTYNLEGTTLNGRYYLEAVIGSGGFATVYRARDTQFRVKQVAVKVLNPEHMCEEEDRVRFKNEAMIAGQLEDENEHIVRVTDYDECDGWCYFVMEYLQGTSLRQLLERLKPGALPWIHALQIAEQLCEALDVAHRHGIVHRDLKPENVFLVRRRGMDHVKLLDLGIAKMLTADGIPGTRTVVSFEGSIIGSSHYMSPEQVQGRECDTRADIYSLGVVLYEMLTGAVPFPGENEYEVFDGHVKRAPPRFSAATPAVFVPAGVEAIVQRALAKECEARFADVRAMRQAMWVELSNAQPGRGLRREPGVMQGLGEELDGAKTMPRVSPTVVAEAMAMARRGGAADASHTQPTTRRDVPARVGRVSTSAGLRVVGGPTPAPGEARAEVGRAPTSAGLRVVTGPAIVEDDEPRTAEGGRTTGELRFEVVRTPTSAGQRFTAACSTARGERPGSRASEGPEQAERSSVVVASRPVTRTTVRAQPPPVSPLDPTPPSSTVGRRQRPTREGTSSATPAPRRARDERSLSFGAWVGLLGLLVSAACTTCPASAALGLVAWPEWSRHLGVRAAGAAATMPAVSPEDEPATPSAPAERGAEPTPVAAPIAPTPVAPAASTVEAVVAASVTEAPKLPKERLFDWASARRYIEEQHGALLRCNAGRTDPLVFRMRVTPRGSPVGVKVESKGDGLQACVKQVMQFGFDASTHGATFRYTLMPNGQGRTTQL